MKGLIRDPKRQLTVERGISLIFFGISLISIASAIQLFIVGATFLGVLDSLTLGFFIYITIGLWRVG